MQKMIAVDRLARPDEHILVPVERIRDLLPGRARGCLPYGFSQLLVGLPL